MTLPTDTGPYLQAFVFCRRVKHESAALSIDVIDWMQLRKPPHKVSIVWFTKWAAGEAVGEFLARYTFTGARGKALFNRDLRLLFDEDSRLIVASERNRVEVEAGEYQMRVELDGRLVGSFPLHFQAL